MGFGPYVSINAIIDCIIHDTLLKELGNDGTKHYTEIDHNIWNKRYQEEWLKVAMDIYDQYVQEARDSIAKHNADTGINLDI